MSLALLISKSSAQSPCTEPLAGSASAVSRAPQHCHVLAGDAAAAHPPERPLLPGRPLYAGERIECDVTIKVHLTFCATRGETDIPLGRAEQYLIPVVTAAPKEAPAALQRAARVASAASPLPTCDQPLGSLTVRQPTSNWWAAYGLAAPDTLLKSLVTKSGCFTLVEPGQALSSAHADIPPLDERSLERDSAAAQTRGPADFVLLSTLVQPQNAASGAAAASGTTLSGLTKSFLGMFSGATAVHSRAADVKLALLDTHSVGTGGPRRGSRKGIQHRSRCPHRRRSRHLGRRRRE
jgi:hypothetical protein